MLRKTWSVSCTTSYGFLILFQNLDKTKYLNPRKRPARRTDEGQAYFKEPLTGVHQYSIDNTIHSQKIKEDNVLDEKTE